MLHNELLLNRLCELRQKILNYDFTKIINNYLSELSTRAPAFIKAKTAFAEPADAAHNSGGRPSLSIISTLEPG